MHVRPWGEGLPRAAPLASPSCRSASQSHKGVPPVPARLVGTWIPWERQVTTEAPRDGDRTWRQMVPTEPAQSQVPRGKSRHRRSPEGCARAAAAARLTQAQTGAS